MLASFSGTLFDLSQAWGLTTSDSLPFFLNSLSLLYLICCLVFFYVFSLFFFFFSFCNFLSLLYAFHVQSSLSYIYYSYLSKKKKKPSNDPKSASRTKKSSPKGDRKSQTIECLLDGFWLYAARKGWIEREDEVRGEIYLRFVQRKKKKNFIITFQILRTKHKPKQVFGWWDPQKTGNENKIQPVFSGTKHGLYLCFYTSDNGLHSAVKPSDAGSYQVSINWHTSKAVIRTQQVFNQSPSGDQEAASHKKIA